MTAEFWSRLLSIIVIDLTLAGDNALVIAMAVHTLPRERQFWARILGTAAAVVLRLVFIAVATFLMKTPLLQALGGVVLVWIAVKLVLQGLQGQDSPHQVRPATSTLQAMWVILVADAVMSLDNVLAVAGAARGEVLLVVIGIGLSLPLVVWGSGILAALMDRFEWIIWLGGGILGYVAGEMVVRDAALVSWLDDSLPSGIERGIPAVLGAAIVALAWWSSRARQRAATRQI
jgi:YjbE family integral membrane protein